MAAADSLGAYLAQLRDERLSVAEDHLEAAAAGDFEARLQVEVATREAAEFESRRALLAKRSK